MENKELIYGSISSNKEEVCPVCNKKFHPASSHIYKNKKDKKVCSYTCARKSGWKRMSEIEQFINHFKGTNATQILYVEDLFLHQNCYYFAVILNNRFKRGTMMYDENTQHFVIFIDNRLYDITGDVTDKFNLDDLVEINYLDQIDNYDLIKRSCIELR